MAQTLSNFLKKILNELPWKEVVPTQQGGDASFLSVLSGGVESRFKVDGVAGSGQSSVLGAALDAAADGGTRQGYGSGGNQDKGGSGYGTGGNTDKGGVGIGYGTGGNTDKGDGGTGHGTGGNPDKGDGGTGHGAGGNPAKGDGGTGHGAGGNPDKGGEGTGHGAGGNPDKGSSGNGKPDDAGNPGNGNPDGTGTGDGKPDDAGNPGKGNGDGSGDGDGISDKPDPAPTPPDIPLLFDTIEAGEGQTQYSASYVFKLDDVTVGWDGETLGSNPEMLSDTKTMVTKEGLTLHAIDSEFGFYVTDFVGAQGKVFDGDFGEGWVGELSDGNGIAVANASTAKFTVPAKMGTWLAGLGGNSVKASTEHYSVMQAVLSNQAYPGDPTALYNLDDNLWIVDYKVLDDGTGMPDLDAMGQLQEDDFHHFYIAELAAAMAEAEADTLDVRGRDFNGDGVVDASEYYQAYMSQQEFDGVLREVAVLDFVETDTVDFVDGALNGFGTYGIQDFIAPNESSVIEDIAVGNDYSVTVKDDGKLLYRWGNMVKRPNDVRIDTKIDLPDEWTAETYDNGLAKLFRITDAELIINHTVTNNPNDQVRPEDYENESAIGTLPSYVEVRDPFNEGNTLWVAPKDMYAGDGTLLPAYLTTVDTGIVVEDLAGGPVGYYNAGGTVLRDFSLASTIAGTDTFLDDIGAMSKDLIGGFTEAWYTTMDREPFMADYVYDDEGNPVDYDTGPRWRLQPEKYGQDLPGVVIPQDPTDPLPIQHGEERYEVGADTTTVLNLLDWNGTSPMALSAGWIAGDGDVSGNGVNMTDMLDTAFYIKGDKKPVNLYDAELRLIYEEVDYETDGTVFADTLLGANGATSHNVFDLSGDGYVGTDGWADLVVLGYGATEVSQFGTNDVYNFGLEEGDALGLIGFDLDPDNYNIHITQEVTTEGNLDLFLDTGDSMGQIATLYGVNEYLEADSFYFA